MMEKPSAQVAGRAFVRHYYTVLYKEPENLHSFYGKDSLYIHGGLVSNGRSEIQKRVTELSLRDCNTRIRHMYAHFTLSEGIVVQVMGEQSNNMQPMRRFMQTFFLAPEGTICFSHNFT
uniref:NTF2 domain-containing protein n=1 Tax=Gouania willdenowi TaxID=441366 RepID=A0A8C5HMB7_GOUWI